MPRIKVIQFGLGPIGVRAARLAAAKRGMKLVGAVDVDPAKVGRDVDGVPVLPTRDLAAEVRARGLRLAILAVPAEVAQAAADQVVAAGIKAVLNFAPARIRVPRDVRLKHVDLSIELETLSFYLARGAR